MAQQLPLWICMEEQKESPNKPNILTVDDDELMLSNLAQVLGDEYLVTPALTAGESLGILKIKNIDAIVLGTSPLYLR